MMASSKLISQEMVIALRAVVFQQSGQWVAQCLENNLASCAMTQELLSLNLIEQIECLIELNPNDPFADFKPAPRRFFDMFDEAKSNNWRVYSVGSIDGGRVIVVAIEYRGPQEESSDHD